MMVERKEVSPSSIDNTLKKARKYGERLDNFYTTCDYETMKILVSLVPIKMRTWQKDVKDCDNQAYDFWRILRNIFPTLAIGVCHVTTKKGRHALNWCIYKSASGRNCFSFIEPQTGNVSNYDYKPYFMMI